MKAVAGSRAWLATLSTGALALLLGSTGCQVDYGGQTLPSPFYQQDDIQYFPAGPEFKLTREATAQRAARAQERARLGGPGAAGVPGVAPPPAGGAVVVPGGPAPEAQLPGPGIAPAPGEEGIQPPNAIVPPPDGGNNPLGEP